MRVAHRPARRSHSTAHRHPCGRALGHERARELRVATGVWALDAATSSVPLDASEKNAGALPPLTRGSFEQRFADGRGSSATRLFRLARSGPDLVPIGGTHEQVDRAETNTPNRIRTGDLLRESP